MFCYPQVDSRRNDVDSLGQVNPRFVSRIKDIMNPKRNTPPFGSTTTWAIDADISINIILLLCTANHDMTKRNEKVRVLIIIPLNILILIL